MLSHVTTAGRADESTDGAEIWGALAEADVRVLLMVLVHLTGERRWLRPPFTPERDTRLFADESAGLALDVQDEIREAVFRVLAEGTEPSIKVPDESLLVEMMSTCLGEPVPAAYAPMILEQTGLGAIPQWRLSADHGLSAIIIGAGASGLCAAIGLRRIGVPFTILEQHEDLGGTWFANTYPDCRVDTPNHFYSYSFSPNPGWSHFFAPQPEIQRYLSDCADKFDVRQDLRLGVAARRAEWDDTHDIWSVHVMNTHGQIETIRAPILITAVGQLNRPSTPDLPGIEKFSGPVFHTAQWRHDVDLHGARVAVIGTGASAMQVAPAIAVDVEQLTIFQRSPQWARPIERYLSKVPSGSQWLFLHVPFYEAWYRFTLLWRFGDGLHRTLVIDPKWDHPERAVSRRNDRHRAELANYIAHQLAERPDLIPLVTPDYPPFGKRMLVDNGWFDMLKRPNVELVTDAIDSVSSDGLLAANGRLYPADVLIFASGFQAHDSLGEFDIRGRKGVRIKDRWGDDDPRAYLGMTVPHFPNLFVLYGPNTNLAFGGSIIFHAECQTHYLLEMVKTMTDRVSSSFEVHTCAHDDYNRRVDDAHARMVWAHPKVSSWYRNRAGRVVANSPWPTVEYWHMTRHVQTDDYTFKDCARAATARRSA
jgi:4-hydroxyacetophenone monooxygenase